jgi:flagellar biosynthesis protein FlhG
MPHRIIGPGDEMKSIDELDHYELLEISPHAGQGDIERAYRLAQQTYADGSLALYSIIESIDAAAIRSRLDEAYGVLTDPESREAYDREYRILYGTSADGAKGAAADAYASGNSGVDADVANALAASDTRAEERSFEAFDEIVEEYDALEEEGSGEYDGVRLRRTRLFRGYEIEDISDITKVSGNHLRNIEEENFQDLPADVYVRGFVTAYAKTIGLDPKVVVPGYMARIIESRASGPRMRFLGRR